MSKEEVALKRIEDWFVAGNSLPDSVSKEQLAAFVAVESGGNALDTLNRPIIRFENHIFYDRFGKNNLEIFQKHYQFNSSKRWTEHKFKINELDNWTTMHTGDNQIEWSAMTLATGLLNESFEPALESASFGLGQVMCFHWKRLGYNSAKEFMESAFDINNQISHMVKFIQTDAKLLKALQIKDWATVAKIYNGSGQVSVYQSRLLSSYNLLNK